MANDFLQREISGTSSELLFATINKEISQQATSDFLERATSATSNKKILQRVTSEFLQRETSATSNKRTLQRATSATSNECLFATSSFCKE